MSVTQVVSSHGPLPIAKFFDQFAGFTHRPQNHPSKEINRLRKSGRWDTVYDDEDELKDAFRDALTLEFNAQFGTDADSLAAWQGLCERIDIQPVPDSLKECRKVVNNTHINLVDLVHTSRPVRKFKSVYALSAYTMKTHKFFPRENANAGNLLKYLLRHIFDPSKNGKRR